MRLFLNFAYLCLSSDSVVQPLDYNKLSEISKTETLYINSMMMDTPSGNTNNGINLYEDGGNDILIRNIQKKLFKLVAGKYRD